MVFENDFTYFLTYLVSMTENDPQVGKIILLYTVGFYCCKRCLLSCL